MRDMPGQRGLATIATATLGVIWILAGLAVPSGARAAPGKTRAALGKRPGRVTRLCGKDLHMIAATGVDIRNNNFKGQPECLANQGKAPGFTVTRSGAHAKDAAFPNAFAGCETSVCSPHSGMPAPVRNIRSLTSTWRFTPARRWKGDATYDLWFDPRRRTRGQDTGAEIMVWTDARGLGKPAGHPVTIDGARWRYSAHRTRNSHGQSWNYLLFWKVTPSDRIDGLSLKPFIAYGEQRHEIRPRWWLTGVEAGFELWSGGTGMRTDDFGVSLKSG